MGDRSLFFYGTLMSPAILHRVIHGPSNPTFPDPSSSYVRTTAAVLPGHKRHRVRGADYPAVVPDPSPSSACVRGTLASGLTDADVRRLDIFEGDEYERRTVKVHRLLRGPGARADGRGDGDAAGVAGTGPGAASSSDVDDDRGPEEEVETYVWTAGGDRLESEEWDFETFKRDKMRFWIGADGVEGETGQGEFSAVDGADGTGGRRIGGQIGVQLANDHRQENH